MPTKLNKAKQSLYLSAHMAVAIVSKQDAPKPVRSAKV